MSTSRMLVVALAFVLAGTGAQAGARGRAAAPTFEQYPARVQQVQTFVPVRIEHARDRLFRTRLRGVRPPINFAGHYMLTVIGCGASCMFIAAIDARNGKVAWLPYSLCCWADQVDEPLRFRRDSELVMLNGLRDERGRNGPHYVRLVGGRFVAVKTSVL